MGRDEGSLCNVWEHILNLTLGSPPLANGKASRTMALWLRHSRPLRGVVSREWMEFSFRITPLFFTGQGCSLTELGRGLQHQLPWVYFSLGFPLSGSAGA